MLESVLLAELGRPAQRHVDRVLLGARRVFHDGADREGASLEAVESACKPTLVVLDLIEHGADHADRELLVQILHERCVDMKQRAALVVRIGIPGIDIEAGDHGEIKTSRHVEIGVGERRRERPIVHSDIVERAKPSLILAPS